MRSKICVLVPAYNEELCIQETLEEILQFLDFEVLVIDDASTDRTVEIVQKLGVNIISLDRNHGAGIAFQKALGHIIDRKYDYVLQLDADGQHNPKDVPRLLSVARKTKADLVIGSRYIKDNSYYTPSHRWIGIRLLSWVLRFRAGKLVTDPTSGFRLYSSRALLFMHRNFSHISTEAPALAKLHVNGYVIHETPVVMRSRAKGTSKLTFMRGSQYLLKSIVGVFFAKKER